MAAVKGNEISDVHKKVNEKANSFCKTTLYYSFCDFIIFTNAKLLLEGSHVITLKYVHFKIMLQSSVNINQYPNNAIVRQI